MSSTRCVSPWVWHLCSPLSCSRSLSNSGLFCCHTSSERSSGLSWGPERCWAAVWACRPWRRPTGGLQRGRGSLQPQVQRTWLLISLPSKVPHPQEVGRLAGVTVADAQKQTKKKCWRPLWHHKGPMTRMTHFDSAVSDHVMLYQQHAAWGTERQNYLLHTSSAASMP